MRLSHILGHVMHLSAVSVQSIFVHDEDFDGLFKPEAKSLDAIRASQSIAGPKKHSNTRPLLMSSPGLVHNTDEPKARTEAKELFLDDSEVPSPALERRLPQGICKGNPLYCHVEALKCSDDKNLCLGRGGLDCPCEYDPSGVAMLFSRPLPSPVIEPGKKTRVAHPGQQRHRKSTPGQSDKGAQIPAKRKPSPEKQRPTPRPAANLPQGKCMFDPSQSRLGLVCTAGTSFSQCSHEKCSLRGAKCQCQWDPALVKPPFPKGHCSEQMGRHSKKDKRLYCHHDSLQCSDQRCYVLGEICQCTRTPARDVYHNPFPKAIHY